MPRVAVLLAFAWLILPPSFARTRYRSGVHVQEVGTRSSQHYDHTPRSSTARRTFQRSHPCPSTGSASGACSGYVVDHVIPLKRGGADSPSNMQWQTIEAAKAKDRIE
jgi:5-methylcytosine-specific restriction endonuclease McrA